MTSPSVVKSISSSASVEQLNNKIDEVYQTSHHRLKPENAEADLLPSDDYKEFLELAVMILGRTPERKKGWSYTILRPGAGSHARCQKPSTLWSSRYSSISSLKPLGRRRENWKR